MSSNSEQNNCDAHLQAAAAEIEALKRALNEKQNQLLAMESACLRETDRQVELEDSVIAWQDKYDRLYESHKRVQKVNQSLEDKLLKLVDRNAGERAQLTSDVATLSVRLAQANYNIAKLQREIERYKTDINLAIQLLQCKPDSFVSQKVSSLPIDIQSKVSSYMRLETNSHSDSEGSTSGVGVATSGSYKVLPASDSPPPACPFPPTAMVYSMRGIDAKSNSNETSSLHSNNNCATKNNNNNNISTSINSPLSKTHHSNNTSASIINNNNTNNNTSNNNNNNNNNNINNINNNITTNGLTSDPDMISPALMAKFLEEELKSSEVKHCDTCQCSTKDLTVLADVSRSYSVSTQTPFSAGTTTNLNEPLNALCLRCNSNLNSPSRTNSPYLMKLVKSSDSVISETKSSVSDLNDVDKLFTPAKREDLMVNPILGHHRLCERTAGSGALNSGANLANSHKFNYPNSSLVNYQSSYTSDSATKYILEPCNTPTSNGNGYQRKFLDGGGTALDLLEYRPKYDASNTPKLDNFNRQDSTTDGNGAGNDDIEDEAKPLLGGISQTNLLDSEKKFDHDHSVKTTPSSACDSGSNNKMNSDLTKTTMSGSVNSLWSKTSSCEGAKMFENFNRNLIKTIKAENPKYRGPRLCAMRIQQNGQSNVLLDNIESIETVTPIIYTRRERFLDEELDDNKDIITSKTSTTVSPMQKQNEINISESTSGEVQSKQSNNDELQNQNIHEENQITDEQQSCQGMENRIGDKCDLTTDSGGGLITNSTGVIPDIVETHNAREVKTPQDEEQGLLVHNVKLVPSLPLEYTAAEQDSDRKLTNSFREQHHKTLISSEQQQQLLKASLNYDVLHKNDVSCKNSQKSYTQSSSISDVIDFQESMMLRRQQLSRVAEWVQNNSQQLQEQQQQEQQHQQPTLMTAGVNHGGCSSGTTDQQSSYSAMDQYDSISMEKLSMDSGYKTTPQLQTNGYTEAHSNQEKILKAEDNQQALKAYNNIKANNNACNNTSTNINNSSCKTSNTYYRRTGRSGLPIPYNTLPDEQTNCSSNCTMSSQPNEQGTTCDILNYKYYPSESDRSLAIKAELHTTTKHVDIAQMEYNVKQFLLKQNEWSIRNSRANTTTSASRSNCNNTASATAQNYSMNCNNAVLKQQHEQGVTRSLRQSKLFNSSGIGPGVGERVLAKSMTTTTVATSTTTTTAVSGKIPGSTTGSTSTDAQQRSTPHRTETNL